jgi:hypothetical protein
MKFNSNKKEVITMFKGLIFYEKIISCAPPQKGRL